MEPARRRHLRILAGLARPSAGWAEVDGVDVATERDQLHELVGYMPDFFGVYDSMTAAEYLAFYASCYRLPKHLTARVVTDLLELVHLGSKQEAQVNTLSRGMKQRLCLARALVHDPKVLLLDEPASGLDPRARGEMRELVQALREMGKTIVLSSHILPELAEMCTSYGIIHDGRMVAHGPAGAILGQAGPRRARARVQGDLEESERLAQGIAGVSAVRRAGPDTLEIDLAGRPARPEMKRSTPPPCLGPWWRRASPVVDFREDDGGLEQLFLQLTAPTRGGARGAGRMTAVPLKAQDKGLAQRAGAFLPPSPGTRSSAKSSGRGCAAGTRSHCSPATCA